MKKQLLTIWVIILFFTYIFSVVVAINNNIKGSNIELGMEGNGWNQTFGGGSYDEGYSVQQTTDDGYIITGATLSFGAGDWDVWLIKTDPNGIEEWNSTFGGSSYDRGYSVQQTNDGGYIIAGCTHSYGEGEFDVWLIRTDPNGIEEWNSTFGGSAADRGRSVQQTTDDGYIITGWAASFGAGDSDVWLIKTGSGGNEEWNSTYGFEEDSLDWGYSVQQTNDGGYIIAGATMPDGWILTGSKPPNTEEGTDVWLIKTGDNGSPEPNLQIKSVEGGLGITAVIENVGDGEATNVEWHILVEGGFLSLIDMDANGTETELKVANELTVKTGSLGLFRLGSIKIVVTVEADNVDKITQDETGFVLGPFVLIR